MATSILGTLQQKLKPPTALGDQLRDISELLVAVSTDSTVRDADTTFSPPQRSGDDADNVSYLGGLSACGPRSSAKAAEAAGFPEPRIDELFLLLRLLTPKSPDDEGSKGQQRGVACLLQKLDQCKTLERLLDLASQGTSWYFQSAQLQQRHAQSNHSVMNGSSYLGSISHTQQPSTISIAPTHVPHSVGTSLVEMSLLRLTLVCDALFLLLHSSLLASAPAATADDDDELLVRRRTSSRLRSGSQTQTIHVPPRTAQEWRKIATRIASLVMLTSDAQEDELVIRRCGLSLTGALAQVLPRCTASPSDAVYVPDMLFSQQVHHHCPSHFILMNSARSLLAAAHSLHQDRRREHATGASGVTDANDDGSTVNMENVHHLLRVLAASRATRCVLHDTLYIRTFGDPCGVYNLLASTVLAPAVCSFVDAVSVEFWRRCGSATMQSYTWALTELMPLMSASNGTHQCSSWGDSGRMVMLTFLETEVFASRDASQIILESPASPNATQRFADTPEDHWAFMGAWVALQASLMLEPSTSMPSSEHAAVRAAMRLGSLFQPSDPQQQHGTHNGHNVVDQLKRITLRTLTSEHDVSVPREVSATSGSCWFVHPDLSQFGGPSSTDHDAAVSLLLLVDAFLWTIEGQSGPHGRRLLHDKILEASQHHVHISSLFQDIAHTTLSAQALQTSPLALLSGTSVALSMRCIGRHYTLLAEGATLPLLEYLICDDVMRRVCATPTTAESAVHPMLLTTALVSNSPPDIFAGAIDPVMRTLSLAALHEQSNQLPLSTRALLADTWLRIVHHAAQGCPTEFSAVISGGTESQQLLSLTLLHQAANVLVLSLHLHQEHVATMGTDPVRAVILDCLQLLTTLSAAGGNADAIVRHEVSWNGQSLSLFHLLLSLAFESHDADVVEAATALIVDALEHYQACDAQRQQNVRSSTDEAARPLHALRRSNATSSSSAQKASTPLSVLKALAAESHTLVSVPRLLILKAILIYDAPLFDFLFPASPPPASTAAAPVPKSPKPTGSHNRVILLRLLQDTLTDSDAFQPRDRAEALELIRRLGPLAKATRDQLCNTPPPRLTLVHAVEATRMSDAFIAAATPAADGDVPSPVAPTTATFSKQLMDHALLVSAAVRYASQEMANAVASHTGSHQSPGVSDSVHLKPRAPPLSPMTSPAQDGTHSATSINTSTTRCPVVVNHAQHLDEVIRRALRVADSIVPVAKACMAASGRELELLDQPLFLGEDYIIRRVRMHYGDTFAFTAHTRRAAPVCAAANQLASAIDVLTEISESVEALFLAVYRDYTSGAKLTELATIALSTLLALLPVCAPVHPSLGWYSGRLLHSLLRAVTSVGGCIRTELDRVTSGPAFSQRALVPATAALRLSDEFHNAYDVILNESTLLERDDVVGTLLVVGSALVDVLRTHHAMRNVITVKSFTIPTPVELMTRAVQARVAPPSAASSAPALSLEFLDCIMTAFAAYGSYTGPLQSFTLVRCLWQALHYRLNADRFFLTEATPQNTDTLIICRLLDALTTLVLHGPVGTALHVPLEELLQAVALLGGHDAVTLGGFIKGTTGAVEVGWYSVWRGCLTMMRAMVLTLPHDAAEWLDAVVSCLATSPRFQSAICGPQRPQAPAGLASAAAAADYEASVIIGELRESELAAQLLSCAAVASSTPQRRRHSTRVFSAVAALVDCICIGFAVLRKPAMILAIARRGADARKDAEIICGSIVQDHLSVLSWWCAESEGWLGTDFQPQRSRATIASGSESKFAVTGSSVLTVSDWPAVGKSVFSLDALRDFLVGQFTAIKKIHRDVPFTATPSSTSAQPPSTPNLLSTSLSPSIRGLHHPVSNHSNIDGAESVVDSEVSYSQQGEHSKHLQLHVQSIKAAVHLFVRAVQVRFKVHTQSGSTWTGPARDTAEKLEWNLKSISSDLRTYDNMADLSVFLENARLFLDTMLHRGQQPPTTSRDGVATPSPISTRR